jgi:hypothetical protein
VFTDQVVRSNLLSDLHELVTSNPVVSVEGLPGCGKTYLVASYLSPDSAYTKPSSVLWYDTREKESLNDFLTSIETEIKLASLANESKCKELLYNLSKNNTLLVIDNYHQVDQSSYSTLISIASRYGAPAHLVLISRTYIDLIRSSPRIGHLRITGFTPEEMKHFLVGRKLKGIGNATIRDLINKTDGLPLAASFFATLVLDFGRSPSELLSGTMLNDERFRMWFDVVLSLIGKKESRLLHILSMCDGPFNIGIVRRLYKDEGITEIDETFEGLQRKYLIQVYSPYRWNVHQLIVMFCTSNLSVEDKRSISLALANYYLAGFQIREGRVLSEEEFFWKIRACKQFQEAGAFNYSERILHDISKTINFRGHYELFIQLSSKEMKQNNRRDKWIDYHHAHFCMITGRLKQSLDVIEPLLYDKEVRGNNKRLAFARLYSEVIAAMGNAEVALQNLSGVLDTINIASIKPIVVSQAKSTKAWLLIRLKRYDEVTFPRKTGPRLMLKIC